MSNLCASLPNQNRNSYMHTKYGFNNINATRKLYWFYYCSRSIAWSFLCCVDGSTYCNALDADGTAHLTWLKFKLKTVESLALYLINTSNTGSSFPSFVHPKSGKQSGLCSQPVGYIPFASIFRCWGLCTQRNFKPRLPRCSLLKTKFRSFWVAARAFCNRALHEIDV